MIEMAELMTVAQFAKHNEEAGIARFNSPQKINAAIRKQDAPVDETTGKRMIDPDVWNAWAESQPASAPKERKQRTQGSGKKSTRPDKIKDNKNLIDEGTSLFYQSGAQNDKFYGGVVTALYDTGAFIQVDEGPTVHFDWTVINNMIAEGKMVVGHIGDMMTVIAAQLTKMGDKENAKILNTMAEQYSNLKRGGI